MDTWSRVRPVLASANSLSLKRHRDHSHRNKRELLAILATRPRRDPGPFLLRRSAKIVERSRVAANLPHHPDGVEPIVSRKPEIAELEVKRCASDRPIISPRRMDE